MENIELAEFKCPVPEMDLTGTPSNLNVLRCVHSVYRNRNAQYCRVMRPRKPGTDTDKASEKKKKKLSDMV